MPKPRPITKKLIGEAMEDIAEVRAVQVGAQSVMRVIEEMGPETTHTVAVRAAAQPTVVLEGLGDSHCARTISDELVARWAGADQKSLNVTDVTPYTAYIIGVGLASLSLVEFLDPPANMAREEYEEAIGKRVFAEDLRALETQGYVEPITGEERVAANARVSRAAIAILDQDQEAVRALRPSRLAQQAQNFLTAPGSVRIAREVVTDFTFEFLEEDWAAPPLAAATVLGYVHEEIDDNDTAGMLFDTMADLEYVSGDPEASYALGVQRVLAFGGLAVQAALS